MNTLDDLRATLAGHADDAVGPTIDPRVHAVHARIARVRRQRRASLAGGLAAVVLIAAGAVGAITLPRHDTPSPALVAGHALPPTVDVYGFGYRLGTTAQSHPGDRRLTLKLPASGKDRVVSLVGTGLGSGSATLNYTENEPPGMDRTSGDSALDLPVPISSAKTSLTVTVTGASKTAQVGLAVYDRTDAMPPGVVGDGAVFRDRVAGKTLLAGAFGKAGQSEVSITVRGPVRNVQMVDFCRAPENAGKKVWIDVSWTGEPYGLGTQCTSGTDEDAGAVGGGSPQGGFGPGRHTVTIRTVGGPGRDAKPIDVPGVRIGVAAYRLGAQTRVLGTDIADTVEANGRTWTLDRVVPLDGGRATIPAGTSPLYVGEAFRGGGTLWFAFRAADGTESHSSSFGNGAGLAAMWGDLIPIGASEKVTLHATRPEARADLLIYRPAD